MKTLILGATGATGSHLVTELLKKNQEIKIIARSTINIPGDWLENPKCEIITKAIAEMSLEEMAEITKDCHAIASCLGHRLTFKGIFGRPRKLVRDAVKLTCKGVKLNNPDRSVKFVLMNTTANTNLDLNEDLPLKNRLVLGLLRGILPPQADNEKAADYLRVTVGQHDSTIKWVAVRPDGLINEDQVTEYDVFESPVRNPVFDAGKTSRINVGNFMARLITEENLWLEWQGRMPVIYNKEE